MSTIELIAEIKKLTLFEQKKIIDEILDNIKIQASNNKYTLSEQAEIMYKEYLENEELTFLNDLDHEDFYETK